ncbi:MAG: extensin family protein, partial [Pseudomonadota bacterium]
AALARFAQSVTALRGVGGYSCRRRYGSGTGRWSEHAYGNALDIATFVLGGKTKKTRRKISLKRDWGPTRRDLVAAVDRSSMSVEADPATTGSDSRKKATEKMFVSVSEPPDTASVNGRAENERSAIGANGPPPLPGFRDAALGVRAPVRNPNRVAPSVWRRQVRAQSVVKVVKVAASAQAARGAGRRLRTETFRQVVAKPAAREKSRRPIVSARRRSAKPGPLRRVTPERRKASAFLKTIHKDACRYFGTVLGPEANDAHRDHFHLDLAPRRRSNYCR